MKDYLVSIKEKIGDYYNSLTGGIYTELSDFLDGHPNVRRATEVGAIMGFALLPLDYVNSNRLFADDKIPMDWNELFEDPTPESQPAPSSENPSSQPTSQPYSAPIPASQPTTQPTTQPADIAPPNSSIPVPGNLPDKKDEQQAPELPNSQPELPKEDDKGITKYPVGPGTKFPPRLPQKKIQPTNPNSLNDFGVTYTFGNPSAALIDTNNGKLSLSLGLKVPGSDNYSIGTDIVYRANYFAIDKIRLNYSTFADSSRSTSSTDIPLRLIDLTPSLDSGILSLTHRDRSSFSRDQLADIVNGHNIAVGVFGTDDTRVRGGLSLAFRYSQHRSRHRSFLGDEVRDTNSVYDFTSLDTIGDLIASSGTEVYTDVRTDTHTKVRTLDLQMRLVIGLQLTRYSTLDLIIQGNGTDTKSTVNTSTNTRTELFIDGNLASSDSNSSSHSDTRRDNDLTLYHILESFRDVPMALEYRVNSPGIKLNLRALYLFGDGTTNADNFQAQSNGYVNAFGQILGGRFSYSRTNSVDNTSGSIIIGSQSSDNIMDTYFDNLFEIDNDHTLTGRTASDRTNLALRDLIIGSSLNGGSWLELGYAKEEKLDIFSANLLLSHDIFGTPAAAMISYQKTSGQNFLTEDFSVNIAVGSQRGGLYLGGFYRGDKSRDPEKGLNLGIHVKY